MKKEEKNPLVESSAVIENARNELEKLRESSPALYGLIESVAEHLSDTLIDTDDEYYADYAALTELFGFKTVSETF